MSGKNIVRVSTSVPAYSSPTFVIEKDGVLYLTVGVLAYDSKAPDLSPEQKRGVKEMRKLYEAACRNGGVKGCEVEPPMRYMMGPLQSGPIPRGSQEVPD